MRVIHFKNDKDCDKLPFFTDLLSADVYLGKQIFLLIERAVLILHGGNDGVVFVPLKCSSRNWQFPCRVPFTKEKMPWCPCPFKNELYGPERGLATQPSTTVLVPDRTALWQCRNAAGWPARITRLVAWTSDGSWENHNVRTLTCLHTGEWQQDTTAQHTARNTFS